LFVEGEEMGSQWRAAVRPLTAESETVLLTNVSSLPKIEDIADHTGESLRSSRVAADCETAAANTNDAVEWLTRVLCCALGHDSES
jgi:quinolinate synthase